MTPSDLRARRTRLGWSQAEAAEHLGLSLRGYRYYEQGETSAGNAAPIVPPPIAIAVLALELTADIQDKTLTPEKLALFYRAVLNEAKFDWGSSTPAPETARALGTWA